MPSPPMHLSLIAEGDYALVATTERASAAFSPPCASAGFEISIIGRTSREAIAEGIS